jgi:glycerophosphoryl diester phosphodiesterase
MEFVAHRGESIDAPENTLAAFRLAFDRGVRSIEIDVHISAEGDLIVCHDRDTLRTTGATHVINETPTAVLRELDAGKWRGSEWAGEKLPLMGEVLELLTQDRRCFVEIKDEAPDAIDRAVKQLRADVEVAGTRSDQVWVISFSPYAIAQTRRLLPEVGTCYLFWIDSQAPGASEQWDRIVSSAQTMGAQGLAIGHYGNAHIEGIARARRAGLAAYVWTVDDEETAEAVIAERPDGIISNNAAHLAFFARSLL